jgi:hypothetical protein
MRLSHEPKMTRGVRSCYLFGLAHLGPIRLSCGQSAFIALARHLRVRFYYSMCSRCSAKAQRRGNWHRTALWRELTVPVDPHRSAVIGAPRSFNLPAKIARHQCGRQVFRLRGNAHPGGTVRLDVATPIVRNICGPHTPAIHTISKSRVGRIIIRGVHNAKDFRHSGRALHLHYRA